MNKKVVYTCITGDYDDLHDPIVITKDFDYICFTDSVDMKSDIWEIRPLPKEVENLSQVKKQRFIKINPHLFLSEYDISIWVDGSIYIKDDLNDFIRYVMEHKYSLLMNKCSVFVPTHPYRKCAYVEANIFLKFFNDLVVKQMERYEKEGFPHNYGLLQSNILLRKHNDPNCIKLMETWSNEVMNWCYRDQFSFNYASWKNKDVEVKYIDRNIFHSKWFYWGGHKQKNE